MNRAVHAATHLRQTSRPPEKRESGFFDLQKPTVKVDRVPTTLPSHRSDIIHFLKHYKVRSLCENPVKSPYSGMEAAIVGEQSAKSTSAESNKPEAGAKARQARPLLSHDETAYLKQYGRELFDDMVENEYKCQFNALLTNQIKITRQLRAAVIDWLFEVGQKINVEDRQVLFQAVNLMDRYYNAQAHSLPTKDLQLTAVTSLFIASKNLEVDPLDLKTCIQTLCFNKYSKSQFLEKESHVRQACEYENEAPSCLDFIMLYIRLLKSQLQEQVQLEDHTLEFLLDMQTIAYDLCKSITLDASLLKYRSHVLAACCIFLGFQLQFELKQGEMELTTAVGRSKVAQIAQMFQLWCKILGQALEVVDIDSIIQFSDRVFDRQVALYEEYGQQYKSIYRERVKEYFFLAPKRQVSRIHEGQARTQESPARAQQAQVPVYARHDNILIGKERNLQQVAQARRDASCEPMIDEDMVMTQRNDSGNLVEIVDQDHFTRSPYESNDKPQKPAAQARPSAFEQRKKSGHSDHAMMVDEGDYKHSSGLGRPHDVAVQSIMVDSEMADEEESRFEYERV